MTFVIKIHTFLTDIHDLQNKCEFYFNNALKKSIFPWINITSLLLALNSKPIWDMQENPRRWCPLHAFLSFLLAILHRRRVWLMELTVRQVKKENQNLYTVSSGLNSSTSQQGPTCTGIKLKTIVSQKMKKKKRNILDLAGALIQCRVQTMYVGSSVENVTWTWGFKHPKERWQRNRLGCISALCLCSCF